MDILRSPEYAVPLSKALRPLLLPPEDTFLPHLLNIFDREVQGNRRNGLDEKKSVSRACTHFADDGKWLELANVSVYNPDALRVMSEKRVRKTLNRAINKGRANIKDDIKTYRDSSGFVLTDFASSTFDPSDYLLRAPTDDPIMNHYNRLNALHLAQGQLLQTVQPGKWLERGN